MDILDFSNDYEEMYDSAIAGGEKYLRNNPTVKTLIIGESGGIDSALTTLLAHDLVNKIGKNYTVVGYSLPISTNTEDEVGRASTIGHFYCNEFNVCDLTNIYEKLYPNMDSSLLKKDEHYSLQDKIRCGNIKARLRMMYLYDKANKYNGMVLSTDNLTEYLLGFWTLHGDVGDFGFIQNLWKTEVYGLAEHLGQRRGLGGLLSCVDAKPTDGLGVTSSDLDQLLPGWKGTYREGYKKIDELLMSWKMADDVDTMDGAYIHKMLYDHPVIERHLRTEFKRNNPQNLSRETLIDL